MGQGSLLFHPLVCARVCGGEHTRTPFGFSPEMVVAAAVVTSVACEFVAQSPSQPGCAGRIARCPRTVWLLWAASDLQGGYCRGRSGPGVEALPVRRHRLQPAPSLLPGCRSLADALARLLLQFLLWSEGFRLFLLLGQEVSVPRRNFLWVGIEF